MACLEYAVTPIDASAHRFRVVLDAPVPADRPLRLVLATWIAGSYVVRDFARHLLSIDAACDGEAVPVEAVSRYAWACTPSAGNLRVVCEFFAHDASVRAAWLDDRRALFNFTSLALRIEGLEALPCRVRLHPPPAIDDWQVVTTLAAADVDARGFGVYTAAGYHDLVDHPVAMGRAVERVDFCVRGLAHAFVALGTPPVFDRQRLAADLAAVCAAQAQVFDALPARAYRFFAQLGASGFGGLEHRDASVLQVPRDALPAPAGAPADADRDTAYRTLLGLCSHEYFHLWNVKRIKPAAVAASDLSSEAYFRDLWAYEGVTSYYDDLGLVRAGVIDEPAYLERLAALGTHIERSPGRHRQTLAQSSFEAWLKFYRPDENTPNAVVSYYAKGAQLALALDLKLRVESDERVSLDTVMRRAWQDYGRHERPLPEHGLAVIAGQVSGLPLDDFFARYLNTTADIPWPEWLAYFGIAAARAPAHDDAAIVLGRLGVRLAEGPQPRVIHVLDDTPAQRGGIAPGDRLVALDGFEVDASLARRLQRRAPGARVSLHLFRGDELVVREAALAAQPAPQYTLAIDDSAEANAHARRARWLWHERASA